MAYIGNTVQNQGFAPAVDYFNGDGTTVTFTLSRPVASVAQLTAVIENVIQNPSTAFTVSGSSITFTSAPPSGTNNIWVEYTSLITTYAAISQDPTVIGDITATGGYSSTGDYGNSFVDGVIMDYVTGNARITTGTSDGITLYNGGTASRSALMAISSAGNVGIGTSSPASKLNVQASSLNYLTFSTSGTNKLFVGVDNGTPELVVGASAGDSIIRTQQQLWFGLNGGGVAGRFDSSGNFYMNSGYGSAATAYGCRAWVNFNGTGTVAIRASGNVSSITDNGTGDYTVNFTTAMPDANYAAVYGANSGTTYFINNYGSATYLAGSLRVYSYTTSAGVDNTSIQVAVFR